METFALWYFGIGGFLSILGIFLIWLLKGDEIEIDDATDLFLGLGLIYIFIAWPVILLFVIIDLIKLIVWQIRKINNSGE